MFFFFFQAEDGIRDKLVTGVQTCALPIYQLKVTVVAGDPDGDPVILTYKWLRNDKEIPGAKGDTLDTKDFRKKDVLAVLVTPSDGKSVNAPKAGLPVTSQNSPPRFTPSPATDVQEGQ